MNVEVDIMCSIVISFGDSPIANIGNHHYWATKFGLGFANIFTLWKIVVKRGTRGFEFIFFAIMTLSLPTYSLTINKFENVN